MGYIEQSLGADEVLVARAHFHWLYYAAALAGLVAGLGAAVYLFAGHGSLWLTATAVGGGLIVALAIMVPIWTTEIGVTNQRLIVKRGFLARHTDEIQLWAIEEANLDQSALGRILGFGRINVQGTGDDALSVPAIADPLDFRKAVQDAIGRASRPANSAGGRVRTPSI
jgi:uncharacterized membrane protein YdbT with pleckstrin-like domain